MKVSVKWLLTLLLFTMVFFLFSFHPTQTISKIPVQDHSANKTFPELPVRLQIPSINVDTVIEDVGVDATGAMGTPNNTRNVGWFDLGVHPGEKGSAVIAGHVDGKDGQAGVFTHLYMLKKGDKVYIKNGNGKSLVFVVSQSLIYNPGYADDVFNQRTGIHLNLITCDGIWDSTKKSYTERLVVFSDIAD